MSKAMKTNSILIVGLLGVGVVIGATLNSSDRDPEPESESTRTNPVTSQKTSVTSESANPFSSTTTSTAETNEQYTQLKQTLDELQIQLNEEVDKRRKLERKIALLEDAVAIEPEDSAGSAQTEPDSNAAFSATSSPHQFSSASRDTNWFNEQALVEAGIDPGRVDYIKDAFEQAEMEKLYLRDQATREGWMGTERYRDAAREIADRTQSLRSELTTSEYDAYLYATGRPNRVLVSSVLGGSPAANAGIKAGDTILQYGNKRIYSWDDLTTATSEGSAETTVTVTVERNGQQQQVYVPRGPLGIRLTTDSVLP
jgi:hypothetical protein